MRTLGEFARGITESISIGARRRWTWIHVASFFSIVLVGLYRFLFSPGVVDFQNWLWPLSSTHLLPVSAAYNPYIWSNSSLDPAGYTRVLTNWPVFLSTPLLPNVAILERVYVVYAFAVEYILAYIAATLVMRVMGRQLIGARANQFRLLIVLLFFWNPAALQWESGLLVSLFWGAPLLLIIACCSVLSVEGADLRYAAILGLSIGFGATWDPRLALWGMGATVVGFAFAVLGARRIMPVVRAAVTSILASAPGVLISAFAYEWAGGASNRSIRLATYTSLEQLSTNSTLPRTLELTGYYITGIFYSPPSIEWAGSIGALPVQGHPAALILPNGALTFLWLIGLASLPILAFGSLLFLRARKVTTYFATLALVGIGLASGTNAPFQTVASAEVSIGRLPIGVLSAIWQTTIGVPIYVIVLTEGMYVPLAAISILCCWDFLSNAKKGAEAYVLESRIRELPNFGRLRVSSLLPTMGCFLLVGAVLFGSWQFATGDFYPGGYSPGVSPNGVPNIGALQPTIPPAADLTVFNFLEGQAGSGNVYWPGANSYAYPWNPRWSPNISYNAPLPEARPIGLRALIGQNLTYDVAPLLRAAGIHWVVVDNMSSGANLNAFNLTETGKVVTFLSECSGVNLAMSIPPHVWLFQVGGVNSYASTSSFLVAPSPNSTLVGMEVGALAQSGLDASLAPPGSPQIPLVYSALGTSFGDSALEVIPPEAAASQSLSGGVVGFLSPLAATASLQATHEGEYQLPGYYSNWSLSVWNLSGSAVNTTMTSGENATVSSEGGPSVISLNYLSSLVNGKRAGIVVSPAGRVYFQVSAGVRSTSQAGVRSYLNVVGSNSSAQNIVQLSSPTVAVGIPWTPLNFSGLLPQGTSYFTLRLFINQLLGSAQIRNLTVRWTELDAAPSTFSGLTLDLSNESVSLMRGASPGHATFAAFVSGYGQLTLESGNWTHMFPLSQGTMDTIWTPELNTSSPLLATINGSLSYGGLVEVPSAIDLMDQPPVISISQRGPVDFIGTLTSSSGGYLELHLQFQSDWRLVLSNGQTIGPLRGFFGDLIFEVQQGNYSVTLSIQGYDLLPIMLASSGAAMAMILIVVWRPPKILHFLRAR